MRTILLGLVMGVSSTVIASPLPLSASPAPRVSSQARVYATLGEISYGCVTIRAVARGIVTGDLDVVAARSAQKLIAGHGIDAHSTFHAPLTGGNSSRGSFLLNPGVQHLTITYSPAVLHYGYRQIPPYTKVDSVTIYYRVPYRSCARWGRSL